MQAARVLTHTTIMCAYFHVLRHDVEKFKLASVLPKMLESKRIGFRTQLATSETLSTLTAFIRHDRPEISVARSKILLFIEDHERWRRSIGFDFTFNNGKIMAFRTYSVLECYKRITNRTILKLTFRALEHRYIRQSLRIRT